MVHDADLEDGKFQRAERLGIDHVFEDWPNAAGRTMNFWRTDGLLRRDFRRFSSRYENA